MLVFLDDIEELPAWRKQKAHNYSIQAHFHSPTIEGVNNCFGQLDTRIQQVIKAVQSDDLTKAQESISELSKARLNLHYSLFENFSGTSYDALLAACYIKSIEGEVQDIKSESDIKEVAKRLEQYPNLKESVEAVKKNLSLNV